MNSAYSAQDATRAFYAGMRKARKARRRRQIAVQLAYRGEQDRVMAHIEDPPVNHTLVTCNCHGPGTWWHVRGLSSHCKGERL